MCLVKTHFLPRLARKDIIVYKVLNQSQPSQPHYQTPYLYFEVDMGEVYKSDHSPWKSILRGLVNDEGIHSFVSKERAQCELDYLKGFLRYNQKIVMVQCIIPKGSWYYRGNDNDIASSELKYEKIIPQ